MRIVSFKIENYKSFRSTPEISLDSGFNVIVGQNNVGKTALVEALSLRFGLNQHRSLETIPVRNAPILSPSTVTVSFQFSRDEILQCAARLGNFFLPAEQGSAAEVARALGRWLSDTNVVEAIVVNGGFSQFRFIGLNVDTTGSCVQLRLTATGIEAAGEGRTSGSLDNQRLDVQMYNFARDARIYKFDAQRLHIGSWRSGPSTNLQPTANNLPEVLMNLRLNNRHLFDRFVERVRTVFPVVQDVALRQVPNDQVEVRIWTVDSRTERDDLTVALADSGTGIAQVLAMLYVVLTSDFPRTIIIDEPQSFLHPGAVRKLIEILRQHPQHQFIITTHSPTAVTAADPDVLLLLSLREAETVIERLDVSEAGHIRLFLAEIGARLSDVFGADNILWVEGRTEEECFPRILRQRKRSLLGTAIVGVQQTGDFEGRRSRTTVEIYERLSRGSGLLPPAVGFVFDREGRSEVEQEDLRRRGKIHFIRRRMYENYLLNPSAIAAVASSIEGFRIPAVTEADVSTWLHRHGWDDRYFGGRPSGRTQDVWLREVRGAKILADVFSELSEQRIVYDKVEHGVALTEWILEHAPDDLREVGELIEGVLAT